MLVRVLAAAVFDYVPSLWLDKLVHACNGERERISLFRTCRALARAVTQHVQSIQLSLHSLDANGLPIDESKQNAALVNLLPPGTCQRQLHLHLRDGAAHTRRRLLPGLVLQHVTHLTVEVWPCSGDAWAHLPACLAWTAMRRLSTLTLTPHNQTLGGQTLDLWPLTKALEAGHLRGLRTLITDCQSHDMDGVRALAQRISSLQLGDKTDIANSHTMLALFQHVQQLTIPASCIWDIDLFQDAAVDPIVAGTVFYGLPALRTLRLQPGHQPTPCAHDTVRVCVGTRCSLPSTLACMHMQMHVKMHVHAHVLCRSFTACPQLQDFLRHPVHATQHTRIEEVVVAEGCGLSDCSLLACLPLQT